MSNYFEELITNNKLGIKDYKQFEEVSRLYTQGRSLELEIKKPIQGNFDYKHLKDIHKYIFQDVFEWAGKDRAELGIYGPFIKENSFFCMGQFLHEEADKIFKGLKEQNFFKNAKDINELAKNMANFMSDLNALHPFREGNGRTQRIFLKDLAESIGYKLDLSLTDKERMRAACIDAMSGKNAKLEALIRSNLRGFRQNLDLEQSRGLRLE
jgi:fic family protein